MQFIRPDINIDFTGKIKIAVLISLSLIVISIGSLIVKKGPRYGVDFSGGTLIQVLFDAKIKIKDIKSGLKTVGLDKSSVQRFGEKDKNEFLIRTNQPIKITEDFTAELGKILKESTGVNATIQRIEMVGPQIGQDLRKKALLAIFYSLLLIAIYISGRFELKWILSGVIAGALFFSVYALSLFNLSIPVLISAALVITILLFWFLKLKYAMGAIVALIHDVIITVGAFSILDKEFTLPVIAAILTVIGYSLNDTIVIFDRIRENLKKQHKLPFKANINKSINETLSRTMLTALSTLVVLISLFIFGGEIIHDFAFVIIVGIVVGTYSSIYIASPILLAWGKK